MSTEETAVAEIAEAPPEENTGKLVQAVVITDAGPCKKHVKVTVERDAINTRFDEKFSDLMVKTPAHIPGFRPGKAPREIVEKKFYKEISLDVKNEVLMASLEQLAEEEKLSPLSPPDFDPSKVLIPEDKTQPLIYEFDIEVRPEFDLPDYKGLNLRRPIHEFNKADVAKETKRVLEPYGTLVGKETNPVAEMDDYIVANLTIKDGANELNKVEEIRLRVEKTLALDDGIAEKFGDAIVGAKIGDQRTVDIVLSHALENELLRGRTVQAIFDITDLKTIRSPELDAAMLDMFGVRSEAQFEELIELRLNRQLEYVQRQTARAQIMKQLAANTKWDLPQDLLRRQATKSMQRKVLEMQSAGMSEEQIEAKQRMIAQDVVSSTAAALKEHFVLQKIAETEKLEIENADIDAEIDSIAERTGDSPRKVRARLQRDDLMESLATELLERRALEIVMSAAQFEDYEFNPLTDDIKDALKAS